MRQNWQKIPSVCNPPPVETLWQADRSPRAAMVGLGPRLLLVILGVDAQRNSSATTFVLLSQARSGTDWLLSLLNDSDEVCAKDETLRNINKTWHEKLIARGVSREDADRQYVEALTAKLDMVTNGAFKAPFKQPTAGRTRRMPKCHEDAVKALGFKWFYGQGGIFPYDEERRATKAPQGDRRGRPESRARRVVELRSIAASLVGWCGSSRSGSRGTTCACSCCSARAWKSTSPGSSSETRPSRGTARPATGTASL